MKPKGSKWWVDEDLGDGRGHFNVRSYHSRGGTVENQEEYVMMVGNSA